MNGPPDTLETPLLEDLDLANPEQIAVGILNEDRLSPDVGVFKTMKQAVDTAQVDKIYCFELRHGELWSTAVEGVIPVFGQIRWGMALVRLLARRNIVYLYKFKIGSDEFFITFKKREDKFQKKLTPKIEDFDITLSQIPSSRNGDEYVAVPLKYDYASGVITYPYFVNVDTSRDTVKATTTTEVYSTIRPQERSNMIITDDRTGKTEQMNAGLVESFMRAVDAIKKVNYGECLARQKRFSVYLHNIRRERPHPDFDDIAQEFDNSQKKGGSAKKNKYTSRIISRKRRLSGKKGRKCRKSYKKARSRKMARNARK